MDQLGNGLSADRASLFAPRAELLVKGSSLGKVHPGGGRTPLAPRVLVASPAGTADLGGFAPSFTPPRKTTRQAIVDAHPVGKTITIRMVEGAPMADRIDLFNIGRALFLSLFILVFL